MFTFIIIATILIFIILKITKAVVVHQGQNAVRSMLTRYQGALTQQLIAVNGGIGCSIDVDARKVYIAGGWGCRPFDFSEIVSCEIIEDGEAIIRTSRASQAVGALVGGVMLGGVGMVIGGLSGSKTTKQKVDAITLRIIVNDVAQPIYDIALLEMPSIRGGIIYRTARAKADQWHALFAAIVN